MLFVYRLNREWRPETLIRARAPAACCGAGAPSRSRGRRRAPDARLDSDRRVGLRDVARADLLLFYSLGLAVPFLLTVVAFTRDRGVRWLRDRYLIVTAVSGVVLIVMGICCSPGS